ncbi:F-box/kelch-repeat protein At3g23880-like [Arachis stenosperma]|uniref:F-box/kelch-repeat protein At3g23880-like n=1 Tax=Arachis stenosperma TaxID=217475 RepID=UPI0025AD64C4|nr:F-box/kelch-repeat protein At3g23880-like [Arachis stenosperma]XP_057753232.1 F-box/kelch-repeat protein At3g23880-like [Arachis stenosperma]XP_057753233.1 F-box/kelch-repeat protein At3g23880-like [Arachis stenosperma]XP_057753234.1 F-box/kelch-repeat protein At3g23880-like [Arachis stenosperma]XP_057753235.1 F-box/kelch-repeat protein At3g23880-like [Arachis stenosperma]
MNCEKLSNPSMDKKKKRKHTGKKAKEECTMEKKKKNHKSKNILEILPLELIHRILLRVPIRHLARLRCVSKLWCSLISDPDFAEFHFHHSPASTNACFLIKYPTKAQFVYLDDNDASQKEMCPPFKKKPPSDFAVLGSCRGFILLYRHPHFLVVWNPLTGFSKRISYSHLSPSHKYRGIKLPYCARLLGFGYDASQDDYLLLVTWCHCDRQYHLDCLSLRTNSWINLNAALSNPFLVLDSYSCGVFLNGAIHWLSFPLTAYKDAILIFDTKERTFSMMSAPEQLVMSLCLFSGLALLGGCLALYYHNHGSCNTDIWVMKEYKVHSSWNLYQIPCKDFQPLLLSSNGDIIGRGCTSYDKVGYFIYNVREDLLYRFRNLCCPSPMSETATVYTESLLPFPSDVEDKKKEIGHQNQNDVKQGKRIRRE